MPFHRLGLDVLLPGGQNQPGDRKAVRARRGGGEAARVEAEGVNGQHPPPPGPVRPLWTPGHAHMGEHGEANIQMSSVAMNGLVVGTV